MEKLSIHNEMAQLDRKNRDFYQDLTDEEKKKFSNYLMIRWASSVEGSRELQEFYLISTNQRLNRHFFDINRHPQLQWLCASSVSPGMGTHRHTWISHKKRSTGSSKSRRRLAELFPELSADDIDVLSKINSDRDVEHYVQAHGLDK
jgi:hypothetical protein